MSKVLRLYTDEAEIRARLAVLYEKANRVALYNESCARGTPDVSLLDEKQQKKLGELHRVGRPLPILRTLGYTIDTHRGQLASIAAAKSNRSRMDAAA